MKGKTTVIMDIKTEQTNMMTTPTAPAASLSASPIGASTFGAPPVSATTAASSDLSTAPETESVKPRSGATPGNSPYYNRIFWAAFKGTSRGMWGGIVLGVGAGALGGVALAGIIGGLGLATFGAPLLGVTVGAGALTGMTYAKDVFGMSGAAAGAVSAGMEINEERRQAGAIGQDGLTHTTASPEQAAMQAQAADGHSGANLMATGELPYNGDEKFKWIGTKHHKEGERPVFFWGVGSAGAAIGALAGSVLAFVSGDVISSVQGLEIAKDLLGTGGAALSEGAATAAVVGGSSLVGASYGVNRHYFRQVFNVTNALYDGSLEEVGKQAMRQQTLEQAKEQVISSPEAPIGVSQTVRLSETTPAGGTYNTLFDTAAQTQAPQPTLELTQETPTPATHIYAQQAEHHPATVAERNPETVSLSS